MNILILTVNGIWHSVVRKNPVAGSCTDFFSQELSKSKCNIEQYMQRISEVTKDKVVDVANKVSINTVYFLKD